MKKLILTAMLMATACGWMHAQAPTQGVTYYLPKTALRFSLLIEKTVFTPGEYARYSERLIKTPVNDRAATTYRIVSVKMDTYAVPDSAKCYTATIDKKHTIINLERDRNGVLMAINAAGQPAEKRTPFRPAVKPVPVDPAKYMTAEILAAGSSAKTAELIAQEIYDIRDSKNQLSRGEADFMPKDGEQLKIMLANLDIQEQAMLSFFQGTTAVDTTEATVDFIPTAETQRQLLFRFSRHLGMVDKDDLGGSPVYVTIDDQKVIPALQTAVETPKKDKNDLGIRVNLPGKIKVTLSKDGKPLAAFDTYAAQFGNVEALSGELWGKKFTTHLVLDPVTGNVNRIDTEALD